MEIVVECSTILGTCFSRPLSSLCVRPLLHRNRRTTDNATYARISACLQLDPGTRENRPSTTDSSAELWPQQHPNRVDAIVQDGIVGYKNSEKATTVNRHA